MELGDSLLCETVRPDSGSAGCLAFFNSFCEHTEGRLCLIVCVSTHHVHRECRTPNYTSSLSRVSDQIGPFSLDILCGKEEHTVPSIIPQ